ncbi:MAG: DNA-binding protein YbiB [Rhodocyclaceae bacterium]|nr:DNA-binding protein YbiB [Rhodocyclaceae bacterium]MBX3670372.1 DNA-binding protein YbiB [Rhodocyclaceae bacterium]
MHYPPLIKEIGRGAKGARSLNETQAEAMFAAMLAGSVPDMELGAILLSMRIKGESDVEMLGFKRALDAAVARVVPPDGPRLVAIPMYNGARRQPNLMPYVARRLAQLGVPVLIHGHFDFDARIDPFALLAALELPLQQSAAEAQAALAARGLAALHVSALAPGLARLLALRPRLGVRNSGHTMVKLLDPAPGRSVRLVAVTHPEYLERMQSFLAADGGRALLMRGTEGECYANPRRRPQLTAGVDGQIQVLFAAEEGGAPPLPGMPDDGATGPNAELIRQMLAGRHAVPQPLIDQIACCLWLSGRCASLSDALALASAPASA